MNLPLHHEPYTDSYFLRSLLILQKEGLNPFVRAQVFIRNGPGIVKGITEAMEIINRYSKLRTNGGRIFSLRDGETFYPLETILLLEGKIQDIITLETMILGMISAETTKINDQVLLDYSKITHHVAQIKKYVGNRQILYFGARHWSFDQDAQISKAVFDGGAWGASTDIGAAVIGKKGIGTIPHSLQCVYAWKYGYDKAVIESIKAFDRWVDPSIPRIALIDFRNGEIDDALLSATMLGNHLKGVRVDTCGENYMQGVQKDENDKPYWTTPGVCIKGVILLRKALNKVGFQNVDIVLSSGFGDIQRVRAFVHAEEDLGMQLFNTLGIGEVFSSRCATMDIVGVGNDISSIQPIAKIGRTYKPNSRLQRV